MKKFTLENAMIKAIQHFKKEHQDDTIRNIESWEWSCSSALFNVEYVDEQGEYHEMQIRIKNN